MLDRKIELQNKERFNKDYTISRDKLMSAAQKAADKLLAVYKKEDMVSRVHAL